MTKTRKEAARPAVKWYGWQRDKYDPRDRQFSMPRQGPRLPTKVSLREFMQKPKNQGALGSCTGHGILAINAYAALMSGQVTPDDLSVLFLYWAERQMEGTIASDAGAQIRDGIKCLNSVGCCLTELWPYMIKLFAEKPPPTCWTQALDHQAVEYERIEDGNLAQQKQCLARKWPFVFGFTVFEHFQGPQCARDGLVKMPGKKEMILGAVGGHCVAAVGYDDEKEVYGETGAVEFLNSWGEDWGDHGYGWLPYAYIGSDFLCSDFWKISKTEV